MRPGRDERLWHWPLSQQVGEAEGSLTVETHGRVGAALTTTGRVGHCQTARVRQARWEGVRQEPATEAPQSCYRLKSGGYGPGCSARSQGRLRSRFFNVGGEAARKVCGVLVAKLQEYSWAPHPSTGHRVNVGSDPLAPVPPLGGGQARCPLMATDRGGAPVVVGGRESRSHGEGGQRASKYGGGMQEVVGEYWHTDFRRRGTGTAGPPPPAPLSDQWGSWRAGCVETRTSGSEGGPGKRTSREAGTAPWLDLTSVPFDIA